MKGFIQILGALAFVLSLFALYKIYTPAPGKGAITQKAPAGRTAVQNTRNQYIVYLKHKPNILEAKSLQKGDSLRAAKEQLIETFAQNTQTPIVQNLKYTHVAVAFVGTMDSAKAAAMKNHADPMYNDVS